MPGRRLLAVLVAAVLVAAILTEGFVGGLSSAAKAQPAADFGISFGLGSLAGINVAAAPAPVPLVKGRVTVFSIETVPLTPTRLDVTENPSGCIKLPLLAHVLVNTTDAPVTVYPDPGCLTLGLTITPGFGGHVIGSGSYRATPVGLGVGVGGLNVGASVTGPASGGSRVGVFTDEFTPLTNFDPVSGCNKLPLTSHVLVNTGNLPLHVFADPICTTVSLTIGVGYGSHVIGTGSWSYS